MKKQFSMDYESIEELQNKTLAMQEETIQKVDDIKNIQPPAPVSPRSPQKVDLTELHDKLNEINSRIMEI